MALLNGLCLDLQAENAIASLFVDSAADVQLRTEAAVCLLNQREAKYHRMVLEFANQSAPDVQDRLFRVLAHKLSVDPAVVGLGFSLLLQEMDKEKAARQNGRFASEYGAFIFANDLNFYLGNLGLNFESDRKAARYEGNDGIELWYQDTVENAVSWWSENKQKYVQ